MALGSIAGRLTARRRLALTFSSLVFVSCALTLIIVYLFMRFVPHYQFTTGRPGVADLTPVTVSPVSGDAGSVPGEAVQGTAQAATLTVDSQAGVLRILAWLSGAVLLVLLVAGGFVGWLAAGRTLRPLRRINDAAALAANGKLDQRTAIAGPPDEITSLSATFDHMLGRLSASLDQHRRFAANASHELQSPLGTTKALLDLAVDRPHQVDLPQLLHRLRETNRRSIETVDALLDLADITGDSLAYATIPVADAVRQAAAELTDLQAARNVEMTLHLEPADASADPRMLRQLLKNLLANAICHNVDGGWVCASTQTLDDHCSSQRNVLISVRNSGPVVIEVDRLIEPFYRERARVRSTSTPQGHGLGLAIVQAIVDAHGGNLHVTGLATGGVQVDVLLPQRWHRFA